MDTLGKNVSANARNIQATFGNELEWLCKYKYLWATRGAGPSWNLLPSLPILVTLLSVSALVGYLLLISKINGKV